jgi:hypothetical protein
MGTPGMCPRWNPALPGPRRLPRPERGRAADAAARCRRRDRGRGDRHDPASSRGIRIRGWRRFSATRISPILGASGSPIFVSSSATSGCSFCRKESLRRRYVPLSLFEPCVRRSTTWISGRPSPVNAATTLAGKASWYFPTIPRPPASRHLSVCPQWTGR